MKTKQTTMDYKVSHLTGFFILLAYCSCSSCMADTSDIPVNIQLKPAQYLHGKDYISTGTNLTAIAEILDEKYKNVSLTYQWSTKNKTIVTDNKSSQISYVFNKADEDTFIKVLVANLPNNTGTSTKNLVIRDPISLSDPEGKLFLEHGELLDIKLKVSGTGPMTYCQQFCLEKDEECKCKPSNNVTNNEIRISYYLRYVGNYCLLIVANNIADQKEKHFSVKIIGTIGHQTIPYVPIVCSISAVFILLSGIALHLKFRKTVYTETANFDFMGQSNEEEDWGEEQSFSQRVRYLLFRAEQDDQDTQNSSNIYGSRSRLV